MLGLKPFVINHLAFVLPHLSPPFDICFKNL